MIEGLKLKLTASELKNHFQKRVTHHKGRADEKEGLLPTLRDALQKIKGAKDLHEVECGQKAQSWLDETIGGSLNSGYRIDSQSILENLQKDIKSHRNKMGKFAFLATHLFEEDYTLTEADLIKLEFIEG